MNWMCILKKLMSEGGFCIVDRIPSDTKTDGGVVDFNRSDKYKSPKLVFNGYKFVCSTTKSYILKKVFDVWSSFTTTAAIIFKSDGIHISEADSDQKLFMMMHLKSDEFLGYHCPENFYMKLNMKSIVEKFSKVRKVKHLTKMTVKNVDELNICLMDDESSKEVDRIVLGELPTDASSSVRMHVEIGLNAEFTFKCKMEVSKLAEIRSELGSGKKITICVDDDSLTFSNDFKILRFVHPTSTASSDRKSIGGPIKISIENNYLKKIIKMMEKIKLHPGGKFDIYFSPKYAFIKFIQEAGGIGEMTYVLASAV